jgi:hypothetical protein
MTANKATRTHHTMDRSLEFFSESELQMRIGHAKKYWPIALLKELIDNALDAAEPMTIPDITVNVTDDYFEVIDNGPGIPQSVVVESLDYTTRTSDSLLYISPSRGQLGNALKTVWAAGFVVHGKSRVIVDGAGARRDIRVSMDKYGTRPDIQHNSADSVNSGTLLRVYWPEAARMRGTETLEIYSEPVSGLVMQFALCNPHADFTVNGKAFARWQDDCLRWHKQKATSVFWYATEEIKRLIAGTLSTDPGMTVNKLVGQFYTLSSTAKRKQVAAQFPTLEAAYDDAQAFHQLLANCSSKRVPAKALGVLSRQRLLNALEAQEADPALCQYKKIESDAKSIDPPWLLEAACGVRSDGCGQQIIIAVNNTPALKIPSWRISQALSDNEIDARSPVTLILHFACPRVHFQEAGKGAIALTEAQCEAFTGIIEAVTEKWRKLVRTKRRDQNVRISEIERAARMERQHKTTIKEACQQVMEEAYVKVSGNYTYPVNARQLMYAVRGMVLGRELVEDWYKQDSSFTQNLLPDYTRDHPEQCENWDIHYDARGHMKEPHTKKSLGLGTAEVRRYISDWRVYLGELEPEVTVKTCFSSTDPQHIYSAVLFVEKEGFDALLDASGIRERWDIASMSTKGMPVTACRELVDKLTAKKIPVFVLRDFDNAGFNILKTLTQSNRRHTFDGKPRVIDMGLRLSDVEAMDLLDEPFVFKQEKDPSTNLRRAGATEDEIAFLVGERGYDKTWEGKRVELNAMTSGQFVEFIEAKLSDYGIAKVVPDQETLDHAWRQAVIRRKMDDAVTEAMEDFNAEEVTPPGNLADQVREAVDGQRINWKEAVAQLSED